MRAMLPRELDDVRRARRDTLELVAGLGQAQLDFRPAPRKWSVGEVLDHLALAEGVYRREIEELVRRAEAGEEPVLRRHFSDIDVSMFYIPRSVLPLFELPFTVMTRVMPRKMGEYLASARWIPTHNPTAVTPRPARPGDRLRSDLEDSLAALEAVFRDHSDVDFTKLVHKHPLFGVNTVPQILLFSANHERRHQAQMRDVMAASGFPEAA